MKAEQFEKFKQDVREILGPSLVGEVGPDNGQYAFCTSEPAVPEGGKAASIDAILKAKEAYPELARCPVMPFSVAGEAASPRTIYVVAGV